MAPLVERVVSEFDQVELVKIEADLDENEYLMREYDIRSLPTFVLLDSEDRNIGIAVGVSTEEQFRNWLNIAIAGDTVDA